MDAFTGSTPGPSPENIVTVCGLPASTVIYTGYSSYIYVNVPSNPYGGYQNGVDFYTLPKIPNSIFFLYNNGSGWTVVSVPIGVDILDGAIVYSYAGSYYNETVYVRCTADGKLRYDAWVYYPRQLSGSNYAGNIRISGTRTGFFIMN